MRYYKVTDGLKYEFERRYNGESNGRSIDGIHFLSREFPVGDKKNYPEVFVELERKMNAKYHPNVNLGAALADGGLLTNHGTDHVQMVISHAFELLGDNIQFLNGYELFLLLVAIHFHDVGNIKGRDQHEERIADILEEIGDSLDLDNVEKQYITTIASAHGGYCNGNKDTIRFIDLDNYCKGIIVRAKVLAAVLRFADEIADDFTRSQFKGIEVPNENEVYHAFAKCLEPVGVLGETIKYHFRVPFEYTQRKLGKGTAEVFLYDEIRSRMGKCMREMEYCKRYAGTFMNVSSTNVIIEIMEKGSTIKTKEKFSFRLGLYGYPDETHSSMEKYLDKSYEGVSYCTDHLRYKDGEELMNAMKEGE